MTEARVVTRDKYPLFQYRCSCGHWQDDHNIQLNNEEDWCTKCYELAEVRLNAENPEQYKEPDDPEHTFAPDTDDPWSKERVPWHVSVYECDRAYGGPEEGGWWYDCGELKQTIPVMSDDISDDDIDELIEMMRKVYPEQTDYGIGSVLYSGGAYEVYAEDKAGESYPKERPHYE
jgi:hypothetical protein